MKLMTKQRWSDVSQIMSSDDQTAARGASHSTAAAVGIVRAHRLIDVAVPSIATQVNIAVKPAVLAQEERQERMNAALRLGFMPIVRSTRS